MESVICDCCVMCAPGEPDNERLGKRLKGDFKKVSTGIKALTSQQLVTLQTEGAVVIEGHTLSVDDIKVWSVTS